MFSFRPIFLILVLCAAATPQAAPTTGTIRGTVTLAAGDAPLHNAEIYVLRTNLRAETGDDGTYQFTGLPPGRYELLARIQNLSADRQSVTLRAGEVAQADFVMSIAPVRETVTVTSGSARGTLETYQSITAISSTELTTETAASLGEVLDQETGIAKRSFGPGTSRPVIRGFDGDRVLIMQDGVRTGTLSSQSGDHGEMANIFSADRIEIVRGPATLLYGSNAVGGVVNVISRQSVLLDHRHQGLSGFLSGSGGSANSLGGGGAGFEYGHGDWFLWGSGAAQRTGDYETPIGVIENSRTRYSDTNGGFGRSTARGFFSLNYGFNEGRYGIPFAGEFHGGEEEHREEEGHEEEVSLDFRRHTARVEGGLRDPAAWLSRFTATLSYTDWLHQEIEQDSIGTSFYNKQTVYRGQFDQQPYGALSGWFGFWGMHRDYKTVGEESIAPPVRQDSFALFGLEELDWEVARLQFGVRLEHTRYDLPQDSLPNRDFTGASATAGVVVPVSPRSTVSANYSHSFRAPALEELYNRGPHIGTLTFEQGTATLKSERGNGVDLSYKHVSPHAQAEASLFLYGFTNFIFLAPTGEVREGLFVADYAQGDARYSGAEGKLDLEVATGLWLNLGLDAVDARLTRGDIPLPRIPPVRGKIGFDARWGSLSVRPKLIVADRQNRLFFNETATAGYAVMDLDASYTVAGQHSVHIFSVKAFNLGDTLYRNHLSFIKELAPEIGRGLRFGYSLRFF